VSTEITYPTDQALYYGLTDGAGLQAFVLVASSKPLPPFEQWKPAAKLTWPPTQDAVDSAWRYDGRSFEPMPEARVRGQVRRKSGPPRQFAEFCQFLRAQPEIDALNALAFPVKAK
jgi:hypothetical protein